MCLDQTLHVSKNGVCPQINSRKTAIKTGDKAWILPMDLRVANFPNHPAEELVDD